MKNIKFALPIIILMMSCDHNNDEINNNDELNYKISDGLYMGSVNYQGVSYWSSFSFEKGKYAELASGGVLNQKSWSCLTKGSFFINHDVLSFELEAFLSTSQKNCNSDMVLPGSYKILFLNEKTDSLVFEKKMGNNEKITYNLKMYWKIDN